MMNKKGLSAIVTVMVLVLIVVAGIVIIWKVIDKTVEEGLNEAKSCYDLIGKIEINSEYTCYDAGEDEMHVSVGVGDVEVESLLIIISDEDSSKSFKLTNELETITNLRNYDWTLQVKIPNKNAGSTYIASEIIETPLEIKLAPVVNGNLCAGDTLTNIGFCSADQCIPNCLCAENLCAGQTCDNECGGNCNGVIEPDCGLNVCGPAPNGCGWANQCGTCTIGTCVSGACSYTLVSLFETGFESPITWTQDWDDNGVTSPYWRLSSTYHSGARAVVSSGYDGGGDLTSDNINVVASGADAIRVEFWYRINTDGTFLLYYYDGGGYRLIDSLGDDLPKNEWLKYNETITDSRYIQDDFRIRFKTVLSSGWITQYVYVDDVNITGIIY